MLIDTVEATRAMDKEHRRVRALQQAEITRLRAALKEIIELEMTDPYDGTGGPIAHAIAIAAIEAETGGRPSGGTRGSTESSDAMETAAAPGGAIERETP